MAKSKTLNPNKLISDKRSPWFGSELHIVANMAFSDGSRETAYVLFHPDGAWAAIRASAVKS